MKKKIIYFLLKCVCKHDMTNLVEGSGNGCGTNVVGATDVEKIVVLVCLICCRPSKFHFELFLSVDVDAHVEMQRLNKCVMSKCFGETHILISS